MKAKAKEGTVIFLKKRALTWDFRTWISGLISLFQGKITHASIVFKSKGIHYVRDMDKAGTKFYFYDDYITKYEDRIFDIVHFDYANYAPDIFAFNKECLVKAKYDYANLFFKFPLLILAKINLFKKTKNKRTCFEDVARSYNILKYSFRSPEMVTGKQLHKKTKAIII